MTTRIELINEALVLNGSNPLGSETAPGAETHIACFNRASELILSCHPWNCSTFNRQLSRLTAPPDTHWAYEFELPPDMLGSPRAVFDRADRRIPFKAYELFGERNLRTDAETIWVQFTKAVPPAAWPGYLREVILLLVRSEMALSIREDRVLRDKLREDAIGSQSQMMQGGLLAAARGADDMGKPSRVIGEYDNPASSFRLSSNWWGD